MRSYLSFILERLNQTKIPTVIALIILVGATVVGWYWIWGLFFLYWAIAAIVMRHVFVIQTVHWDRNPVLFWIIAAVWLILALVTIFFDLIVPNFFPDLEWLGE